MTSDLKVYTGPTGSTTAQNIKRIRSGRRLSVVGLVAKLEELGWPLPVLAIRRIERGERRITVDDLAALAIALDVSPLALLMPWSSEGQPLVQVTGGEPVVLPAAWLWATGAAPLQPSVADPEGDRLRFQLDSRPAWARGH